MKIKSLSFKRREKFDSKRLLDLCEPVDCGIFNPPMDPQVALTEIARWLLGDGFIIANPINPKQINTAIVAEIERRYKSVNKIKFRLGVIKDESNRS